jgi:antitoxin component of MazEF toxin-antitoxin module
MPFVKQLSKVGNSTALILDRPILKQLNLESGAEVEVSIEKNAIVIRPHRTATDEEVDTSALRMFKKHQRSLTGLAKR